MSTYHYYLRDHQGNNRVVADQYGTVEEVNHYYPYGGLFGEGVEKRVLWRRAVILLV